MLFLFIQKRYGKCCHENEGGIFIYLYDKNYLKYTQIARSKPKSKIRDIEGLSTYFVLVNKLQATVFDIASHIIFCSMLGIRKLYDVSKV